MKYHVHVYKMLEKAEIMVECSDQIKAKKIALRKAKNNQLIFRSNNEGKFMALTFEGDSDENSSE